MTEEQFWRGDPNLVQAYKKAQRYRNEQKNEELWLQGFYFYSALAAVISNAFGGKGAKKHKYLEQPIDLYPSDKPKESAETAKQKVIDQLNAWKDAWDMAHRGTDDGNSDS